MREYTLPQLLNIVRSSIKWEASIEPLAYDDWPRLRRIATMDLTTLGLPVMKCYIADFGWIAKQKTEYQDVIMGTNWGRWPFTPRDEFWVDNRMTRFEDLITLCHEGCEYYAIMILGLSYFGDSGAHSIWGNGAERLIRVELEKAMSKPMIIYP